MLNTVKEKDKGLTGMSKENLTIEDLSKICRFCLKSDYYMTDIFTPNNSQKNADDPLPKKIHRSFQLEVKKKGKFFVLKSKSKKK